MHRVLLTIFLISIYFKTEAQPSALKHADSLYVNGNYSKAIKAYQDHPKKMEVYDNIAKAYIALGNYDAAIDNYKKSIETNPDNALFKLEYGKLLARVKKYKEASEVFETLVLIDRLNPNYHYELGLSLEKLQDSTAQSKFKKAFDLDNTHQKAIFRIAKRHLVKRRYDSVDYYADIGLKSYANNKELISLKAQNFYWKEDYEDAAKWFEKLITLNESTLFIHEKLSFCYASIYKYEKAILHGEIALKKDPGNTTNLFIQGQLHQELAQSSNKAENYKKAEEYMQKALLLMDKPLHSEYAKLAGIYSLQKKYKEAIETYKIAIQENSEDAFTHFKLVLVKDNYYKDIDARIKVYENFIGAFPDTPFKDFAQRNLNKLREERFFNTSDQKD